jgi:Flp pilus assembly protein TadB
MSQEINSNVTAMIAPALFLTATGSLLISTSNRIGRIVDRIRAIVTTCESGQLEQLDFSEQRRKHAVDELKHLHARSNRVALAVTMLYMAFGAFAATSMMIAINAMAGHYLEPLPVTCAVGGVGLLIVAFVNLVLEARNSLQGNDREVNFFHELESLRAKDRKQHCAPSAQDVGGTSQ